MWADTGADPLRCPGSGAPSEPAATFPDGWPHGRALCAACQRFIPLHNFIPLHSGTLAPHDTSDPTEPAAETLRRREWFNTIGGLRS